MRITKTYTPVTRNPAALPSLKVQWCSVGIGRGSIVTAEGLFLGADDFLRGGDVVGEGRRSEPDQEDHEESKSAHADIPWLMQLITAKSAESCIHRAGVQGERKGLLAARQTPQAGCGQELGGGSFDGGVGIDAGEQLV